MPGPFPNRGAETTVSSSGYFQFPGSHRPGVSSAVGHHGYGYHAPPTPPYTPRTVPQSLAPMRGPPVIHIPTDYSPPSNSHDRFAISRGTNRPPVALPPTSLHDVEDPASEFMRARLRIPAGHPVSLYSIPDTTDGSRPGIPLRDLIGLAICGSERKMLTLQGIVHAISGRFSFYASAVNEPGWKNSIRHALSLYKIFVLQPRDDGDPGMGGYWRMIIGAGDGYARPRHRTKGSPPHQAQQALPKKQNLNLKHNEDEDSDDEDESDDHSATRPSAASSSTQTGTGKARMLTRSSTKARRL
ncbi:hypothetical protein C8F01DRAFT_1154727 [Mycena amicta]|nr:hypothetical protein C8F01DRAFT_1154727 [Mycena amicta]